MDGSWLEKVSVKNIEDNVVELKQKDIIIYDEDIVG